VVFVDFMKSSFLKVFTNEIDQASTAVEGKKLLGSKQ
jgi:hypothetical protein